MINLTLYNKEEDPSKIVVFLEIEFTQWLIGADWLFTPELTYFAIHFLCFSILIKEV